MSLCESTIKTDHLLLQEPCKSEFSFTVYRQGLINYAMSAPIGPLPIQLLIVVTTRYGIKIEPIGYALGRHLYSIPLAPGEEVEIEIFRSSKVERELSQQYSTEIEFTEEFSNTCMTEWSKEKTSNYKADCGIGFSVDLGIVEFGGQAEAGYSSTETDFQRVISESVEKTKHRVDRKFDIHMGLRTEVENRYRSTRKIKNPNLCRTLTYNYFQLMRKYNITITRIDIKFDFIREPPEIMQHKIYGIERSYTMPLPEIKTLVPTREERVQSSSFSNIEPREIISKPAVSSSRDKLKPQVKEQIKSQVDEQIEPQVSDPAIKTLRHPIIKEAHVLELAKEKYLAKAKLELYALKELKDLKRKDSIIAGSLVELNNIVEGLKSQFPVGQVISTSEICINTNSMHVEPMMGACLACEDHIIELRKLELEKARAELGKIDK